MKIVYVLDDTLDKPDGVQQCVLTIGEYMKSIGHEVHYFVAETHRQDLENVHPIARYISLKFNGNSVRTPRPTPKRKIKRYLKRLKPDVIHIQMPFSPFFGARVLSLAPHDTRIVGTWHTFPTGGLQKLSHRPLSWMIGHALLRVEVTIGVSKPTADFADSIYGTKSIVIPNAVDINKYAVPPIRSKKRRVVFLGRFDERKGPMYLIEALHELNSRNVFMGEIDVVMGGKGPDLELCKKRADEYGLSITFTGFVPEEDKAALLASANITVFPSTGGEAFGISLVEAMASGASIVLAGDNAGYRSILGEKPELLFDPKDTKSFADTLEHFLSLSDSEGAELRKWLKLEASKYDVSRVAEQLLKIYEA